MKSPPELDSLQARIVACRLCPRLVQHREQVAQVKRRAYLDCEYWGKPVPSFGDAEARLLILGLAPAAHGANRTGRMFTGDSSGDWLYRALYEYGFCNQSESRRVDDGLVLQDAWISAALHCVPPQNRPATGELDLCRRFLRDELSLLRRVRVVIALGRIAWGALLKARRELGWEIPRPLPKFAHGGMVTLDSTTYAIVSYHPSRQNTQTRRLTRPMFHRVFSTARRLIDSGLYPGSCT